MATSDPGLHLLVRGEIIRPSRQLEDGVAFELPIGPGTPVLRSHTCRPSDLGISGDVRRLGFAVTSLVVKQGDGTRSLGPAALSQSDGFYAAEPSGWCWTNGRSVLPHELLAGLSGMVTLEVHGVGMPVYEPQSESAARDAALMAGFTSLGQDCEFGLVQRHFDTEPVSLFRWGTTTTAQMMAGLACQFEGLGDPGSTSLVWLPAAEEYRVVDPRYLAAHTWVHGRVPPDQEAKLLSDGRARLSLLRRKLLYELTDHRRIFVHRRADEGFDRATMMALHRLLRGYGDASLLCLAPDFEGLDHGTVTDLGDGLFVAVLEAHDHAKGPHPAWLDLCRAARRLHEARLTAGST